MRLSDIPDDDYYTIEILGKPILGKHLKNPYLRKGIHEEILRRKEEIENVRRFYLNIGDTPVIKFNAKPPAYIIHSNFQGLRDLLLDLDMPEDPRHAYCSMLFQGSNLLLKKKQKDEFFKKYSVEIFGLFLRLPDIPSYDLRDWFLHEKSQYKCQPRYWTSRSGHIVQVWRLRFFSCPVTDIHLSITNPLSPPVPKVVYLEESWHPQRDFRLALCGLEHLRNSPISPFIQFTGDALRAIGKTKSAGRSYWSGKYKSPEEFVTAYRGVYFRLVLETGDEPKQQAVANKLRISVANLKKLIWKSGASWPPL
jgi:hypothetical protein